MQLNDELAESLPAAAVADRELMGIILHPPKGLWLCLHRSDITLTHVLNWIDVMQNDLNAQKQEIAQLKLLFFFGCQEALTIFLALHSNFDRQQNTIAQLLKTKQSH